MPVDIDTGADVFRPQEVLRDLLALSAVTAAWVGKDPFAVATGLADALVGGLQLDFAFVRLCDPGGGGAVDVTRGSAWKRFPEWLDSHLAASVQFPRKEIVADVGDGSKPCRGFVIPIGVNGGLVAVARERGDFPTEIDQLLLSHAANQAATAFESARLIQEGRRAEEDLREARNQLETKVAERTAELRQSEAYLARLAEEQAALRRVATMVARESPPAELFTKVVEELANVFGEAECLLLRDESDGTASVVASWGAEMASAFPVGTRLPTDGDSVTATVLRHGRPHRLEDYSTTTGTIGRRAHEHGARSGVGAPIRVRGRIWGAIGALRYGAEAFPPGTETRMAEFAELVATAIANAATRTQVEQLAKEQAALRRVATLVAQEPSSDDLFAAVAEEACRLLGVENAVVYRYEADGTGTIVAAAGEGDIGIGVGSGVTMEGESVVARILRTGRAARVDDYANLPGSIAALARNVGVRSVVGGPIVFKGQLWGAMVAVSRRDDPLPLETESRIGEFTQLVATAISNADARAEVARLAEEQAALRRVATLVARGASPPAVLEAVATETAKLLASETVALLRYEPDATAIVTAQSVPRPALRSLVGFRVPVDGDSVVAEVLRTRAPARTADSGTTTGPMAEIARDWSIRASVGVPIFVEGSLWGLLHASWASEPPSDTEERMKQFAELVDTAIANAESRDQLTASRARVLAAGDDARRRVVRDLHDGAQQRLVHTIVTLKLARRALHENRGDAADALVGEGLAQAEQANSELRELVQGILPSVLTRGGLRAGISSLVSRIDLPVEVQVPDERFPAGIEASAYFVVAEALTNVVKHSGAGRAEVRASVRDRVLHIEVRDDGVGGAIREGNGLVGLHDRVVALGGRLRVESPPGRGTLVAATLPLPV